MQKCLHCFSQVNSGDRFCSRCGCFLNGSGQAKEHRLVTIVFSDMCGYSSLSENLDPEDLKALMDMVLSESTRIITCHGGIVEKYIGDAVVAMFGLHRTREDDAVQAIRAAIGIHEAVENITPEVNGSAVGQLRMHTGINTGEVLYEISSSEFHHGPLGKPINIAARLSDMAEAGEILIGESLASHAMRYFHIEWVGKKIPKGFRSPLHVHKILTERKIPLPIHYEYGIRSPLVGRDPDLSLLIAGMNDIQKNKNGSVVFITGEAGMGKSRLIHEFREFVPEDIDFMVANCREHAQDTPYLPVVEAIRHFFRMDQSGADTQVLQYKMEELGIAPENREKLSFLCGCGLLHGPSSPDEYKVMVCDAFLSFITAAAQVNPVIFCMEDIHWADQSTRDLLEYLIHAWKTVPSGMLVLTDRNRAHDDFSGIHIQLKELPKNHVSEMIRYMLNGGEISESTVAFLHVLTGGNPFYLEELIMYLLDKGIDFGKLPKGLTWNDLPTTLHGLIGSRIDSLSAHARRVVQEAAIIGRSFSPDLLDAISLVPNASSFLEDLSVWGFINHPVEHEYFFKHDITREVAFRALMKSDRIVIHRKIALELEEGYGAGREVPDAVAFHFEEAQDYEKAIFYRIKAAEYCHGAGAWFEAVAHYQAAWRSLLKSEYGPSREMLKRIWEGIWRCSRVFSPDLAIEALEHLVSCYRQDHMKVDEAFACIRLINLHSQRGNFEKALQLFQQALHLSEGDPVLIAAARTAVAYTFTFLGKPILALELLDQARPVLVSSDPFLLAVNYLTTLAASVWKGNTFEARGWYKKAKATSNDYLDLDLMADIWFAHILCLEGEFEEARRIYKKVAMYEKKIGTLAGGFSYLRIQGAIYFRTIYFGETKEAQRDLKSFSTLSAGIQGFKSLTDLYRAWISLQEGNAFRAKELIEKCLSGLKQGVGNRVPYALNTLTDACLFLGKTDEAMINVLECIRWNEENGNQDQLIWALRLQARIHAVEGDYHETGLLLKRALSLARSNGLKPQKAWILGEWCDLLVKKGSIRKAYACCRTAQKLWKDMGNDYQVLKTNVLLEKLFPFVE